MMAEVSRSVVIATWHCLLEGAATKNNCGGFDLTPRRVAAILCEPLANIEALFSALTELGMIADSAVASWKKRQFESDSSTERSRIHRERQRNGHATLQQQQATPPEADSETELVSSDEDSPSEDGPAFKPEHVFEFYQELAKQIALPVPRDFTPERRQLVRGRQTQYSLEDFKTVFAKCRDSPFLRGERGRTPLSIDWLMKKQNFQKTLEGNYDR